MKTSFLEELLILTYESNSGHILLPTGNICKEGSCLIFTKSALEHILFPKK